MSAELIGQDQTAAGELGVTDGASQEQGQAAGTDLKSRVLQGGDFAWEQIQKRDRHASELANRVKDLEPVEQLVKFAGSPDRLFQLTDLGNRVTQVPGLLQVVQQAIATGRVELPQQTATQNGQDDDEWIDPDAKKVRDTLREEIADLRAQLGDLSRVASSADVRSKEQRVKANIERVLDEFGKDPEAHTEASKIIMDRYKAALTAAERGDQVQARLIDQLASEDGIGVLEFITMPVYKRHAAKLAAAANTSASTGAQATGSKSTDDRTVNPSRPGNAPLPPRPKGKVTDQYVLQVLQEAARRKGIDPRLL